MRAGAMLNELPATVQAALPALPCMDDSKRWSLALFGFPGHRGGRAAYEKEGSFPVISSQSMFEAAGAGGAQIDSAPLASALLLDDFLAACDAPPTKAADAAQEAKLAVTTGSVDEDSPGQSPVLAQTERHKTSLKAGAAFLAATESDPRAQAARERMRAKLEEAREAIREGLRAAGDDLAAQGLSLPETIEDWEDLGRIIGIPLETIQSGKWTAREIHAHFLAWVIRKKIEARLLAEAGAPTSTQTPAAGEPPAQGGTPAKPKPSHSADFTFVNWFGTKYTFALGVQASAVRALWEEWENSGLGLHQETVRNAIDAERDNFRMDTTFRKHPAFGTMIQRCGDGRYKLNPPDNSKAPPAP
jgi:hypothetical protein